MYNIKATTHAYMLSKGWNTLAKKNELVTVVNDFIDLPLKNFTPSEMNLLTTFLAKCKNKRSNLVEMDFNEIREISKYTSRNNKNLIMDIANTNNKLQTLKFAIQTEEGTLKQLVLFPTFEIDPNKKTLSIKVNEDFMYILNDLEFEFTSYEAGIHNSLSSKFSKQAFKQLRRFKTTGKWLITQEKFKELLDIPPKYRQTDIDNRVLKPIMEELSPYFSDLEVEKTYKSANRGRPSVSGYQFTWTPSKQIAENAEVVEVKDVEVEELKPKRAKKSGFDCPVCGKPLYIKEINGSECYCHLDGWKKNAPCSKIYNDISEIRAMETEVNYGSKRGGTSGNLSEVIDQLGIKKPEEKVTTEVFKEKKSKPEDKRALIIKAVPSLVNKLANEYFLLIDAYHESEKKGIGTAAALAKIKELLTYMEDSIENAGFDREDLYTYIFTDEETKTFRNK